MKKLIELLVMEALDNMSPEQERVNSSKCSRSRQDKEDNIFYHITWTRNVSSIEENGLQTGKGENYEKVPELQHWSVGKLFLTQGWRKAMTWVSLMRTNSKEEEDISAVAVRLTDDQVKSLKFDTSENAEGVCDFYLTTPVKSSQIEYTMKV